MKVARTGGAVDTVAHLPFDRVSGLDLARDGKTVLAVVPETKADVWLVENFDPRALRDPKPR